MTIRSWTSSGEVAFALGKQWRSREKQEVSHKKLATRSELQEATKVSYKKSTAWRCVQRWHCDSGIGHQSLWFRGDHEDAIRWLSFWMFSTKTLTTDAYRPTLTDVAHFTRKWTPLSKCKLENCRNGNDSKHVSTLSIKRDEAIM